MTQYEPFEPSGVPVFYIYIFVAVFTAFITAKLWLKWKKRRDAALKWLGFAFTIYFILITVLTLGIAEAVITGYKMELYRFSLYVGYTGILIANIFLLMFGLELFEYKYRKETVGKVFIVLNLIIAVSVALPFNYYGCPDSIIPQNLRWVRVFNTFLMMLISFITYIHIYRCCKKLAGYSSGVIRKSINLVALSQVAMVLFFVFLLLDTLTFTFTKLTGYTFFIYLAWSMVVVFLVTSYMGVVNPELLDKREKENTEEDDIPYKAV